MELQTLPLAVSRPLTTAPTRAIARRATSAARTAHVRRIVFFASLLVLWEAISRFGPWPDYLLPGPVSVGETLVAGLRSGLYVQGAFVSLLRLLTGYGISLVGGVVLGTLLVRYKPLQDTVGAAIVGLQALPSVCWLPLAILWFGLNERAIIFVVVMGSLFSIVLGVQAELLYFSLSLGNLLQTGRDLNDAAQVMSVMLLIVAIGVTFNQMLFAPLERRVAARWGFGPSVA